MRKTAAVALLACAVVVRAATYTTYIGDVNQYQVSAIATDGSGNTYITGGRMVGPGVPATSYAPVTDVFFAKLDLSGNLTLIGTFSGKGTDVANGIAVDTSGNIYVVGNTTSQDFPLHNPLQSVSFTTGAGAGLMGGTGFLMKLSPDGAIVYSTYLGGARAGSSLNAVAADAQGNAYVAGTTQASDYPRTAGLPAGTVSSSESGISGAFFAKVDPAGSHILYAGALAASQPACGSGSTCFFGGQVATGGTAIAVDAAGNAYIAGNTNANGLQGTPGALLADGIGAFVAKVNSAGSGLVYLTYLGSASYINDPTVTPGDTVLAIAADADGSAYISGATSDPAFPATAGALQTSLASSETDPSMGPPSNAFVAKLNPSGSARWYGRHSWAGRARTRRILSPPIP